MLPGLKKYGWEAHDGKSYGRQELYDEQYHLTTSWVRPLAHVLLVTLVTSALLVTSLQKLA